MPDSVNMENIMATPSEKLVESLEVLQKLQSQGVVAIQARDLSRIHRERLVGSGFIQEVLKGWYIPTRPDQPAGESTAWYASYWQFCSSYLNQRFGEDWCLSPEQSLMLHAGNWVVPSQLLIRAPKGNNKITPLPHNTSLLDARYSMPSENEVDHINGLRVYTPSAALVACSAKIFIQQPAEVRALLSTFRDASEILVPLLEGGHSVVAGRIAGAFRNIKRDKIADDIVSAMKTAGFHVREVDPFESKPTMTFSSREHSPNVIRMKMMWHEMREYIIKKFPKSPGKIIDTEQYLKNVDDIYVTDAYHSLSIEGYHVSTELIERVRTGKWSPDDNDFDNEHRNALAASGYWRAFQSVRRSLEKILKEQNAGDVVHADHQNWYRELFGPSVDAGILKPTDLAGYRRSQVFIRCSKHVPPKVEAIIDLMPAFFELLKNEEEAPVRIVLGHFIFVYIHPYMDGNGRIGRFIMNAMFASGGYPWTIIPVERRAKYMSALEAASVEQDIRPFVDFLSELVGEAAH